MRRHSLLIVITIAAAIAASACGASRAVRKAEGRAKSGDWDTAVAYYREAVQKAPNKAEYKIALERAMQRAAYEHLTKAKDLEAKDQLDAALMEYRKASELDPSNRQASARAIDLERIIRDRIEAARPKPPIQQMREQAARATAEPVLNPASRAPIGVHFQNASLRDILNFIGTTTGINIMYDPGFQERAFTVSLDGVTLEQALNQILMVNNLTYKVMSERTILIYPDTQQNRAKYEEQVIRIFFLSNADATELAQVVNQIIRAPSLAVQPLISPNKAANTITVRASASTMALIERIINANDKPRAEIVVEVEILEVNRTRAKQYGLNLTQYALGGIFSPETAPGGTTTGTGTGGTGTTTGAGTTPEGVGSPPPFNLNTISQGVSTADFYLAVPAAVVRFLESDSSTKLIAKPNLRGAEGNKLTLNLGDDVPVPATAFTPLAGGGANINPLTSFTYRKVGVNIEITPRVTLEGDILVELTVENSSRGRDVNIAGTNAPSFGSRLVTTKLRLREGESTLLAGLLREDETKALRGFPGAIHLPGFKQLLSDNDVQASQTDIVILLTPHVVRTSEVNQRDLDPIYVGTGQPGLTGPQFIGAPAPAPTEPAPAAPAPPPAFTSPTAPPGTQRPPSAPAPGVPAAPGLPTVPPGSSPTPGTTTPPATPPTAPAPATPPVTTPPGATPPTVPPETVPPTTPPGAPGTPPPTPAPATPPTTPPAPTPAPAPGTPPVTAAQVLITPPGTDFRVAGGPYTVPISISNAPRLSAITISITYNQAALRVRTVQAGSFMGAIGTGATFTQRNDPAVGRVDITLTRTGDATPGSATAGLLGAIIFDAIAPGTSTFTASGTALGPGGVSVPLQFNPVTVTVR